MSGVTVCYKFQADLKQSTMRIASECMHTFVWCAFRSRKLMHLTFACKILKGANEAA